MDRGKQLAKNTVIVGIGRICTQFITFFLLPLYTAVLSTEEYGTVDLLNTYISLLIPILFLQIDQAIFRFLIDVRDDEEQKKRIISSATFTVLIQIIIYIAIFSVFSLFINNNYKYFLAANIIATMLSGFMLQISRGLGDNVTYSIGSIVTGISTLILNVVLIVVFDFGAYGVLTATFVANLLCAFIVFMRKKLYAYIKPKEWKKDCIKALWKYSIPLIPNQLSWWIVSVSDRTIISIILGVAANGIYSAATKFSSIITSLFNIFNLTWTESASMHVNDEDRDSFFSGIVNSTIKIFTALVFGIIAFMPFVFKLFITGEDYSSAYYQIPILLIATIFNVTVALIGSLYISLKKSNEIAKTSIYAAIINIVINLIFIRVFGLYAASISTLIAYLVMTIYRYFDIQKYIKIKIDKKFIIMSILIGIIILCMYYSKQLYLIIIGAFISVIFAVYYNKNLLVKGIDMLKSRKNKNNKDLT